MMTSFPDYGAGGSGTATSELTMVETSNTPGHWSHIKAAPHTSIQGFSSHPLADTCVRWHSRLLAGCDGGGVVGE